MGRLEREVWKALRALQKARRRHKAFVNCTWVPASAGFRKRVSAGLQRRVWAAEARVDQARRTVYLASGLRASQAGPRLEQDRFLPDP